VASCASAGAIVTPMHPLHPQIGRFLTKISFIAMLTH